jgi:uncharacterized protein involved in response to NO
MQSAVAQEGLDRCSQPAVWPAFLRVVAQEPFRLFFPQAILAGILGVALWPLYFWHVTQFYPGAGHVRIMIFGFFGGFIFGFLGTALPRMLSARPFAISETLLLLLLHAAMVIAFALEKILLGDFLLTGVLGTFIVCAARRFRNRRDTPPPGFLLVALAFLSVFTGTLLAIVQHYNAELPLFWVYLQRLLSTQGFVLFPILGIGPFILPRFFGLPSPHDFPETSSAPPGWKKKALFALSAGVLIIVSFLVEAAGHHRSAHALRFGVVLVYLGFELPFRRAPKPRDTIGFCLILALAMLLAGFLAVALWPAYRAGLLHLTLVGGFAVITFMVATRVVFGHSGNLEKLRQRNGWLLIAVGVMLLGMATRISGDLWPRLLVSHYSYGALVWILGVLLWAFKVLPKVLETSVE